MARFRMRLSYDGEPFRGFAPNEGVPTVGGALRGALETILRHEVPITCAGRTDAGVHAIDQVVHFDTHVAIDPGRLLRSINGLCKPHIAVGSLEPVADDFDARHSCTGRTYLYRILNRRLPDPFRTSHTWHVPEPLDVDSMNRAGSKLVGTHDFSSFCRRQTALVDGREIERSRVRELRSLQWCSAPSEEVRLEIHASSFCQQMVRSIVGLCAHVGLARVSADSVGEILAARNRTAVPRVAPPHGLFLLRVDY